MSTLITIPGTKALHVITTESEPVSLATGDLTLTSIPANPPDHPSTTITLQIGSSAFPLLPTSPVSRVKAKQEHPSYIFTPIPKIAGEAMGRVMIVMKDSSNQGEWDATESLCKKFEEILTQNGLWDEKVKFVNDEYDTAGEPIKGWGENVAAALGSGASFLVSKLTGFTDNQVDTTKPINRTIPDPETAARVTGVRNATAHLAVKADETALKIGDQVHQAGKSLNAQLPEGYIAGIKADVNAAMQRAPGEQPSEIEKIAQETWAQTQIAAKGLAQAAGAVGKSIQESSHNLIKHNFGQESAMVAGDVGQAGANLGQAGLSVAKGTSAVIQGSNLTQGIAGNEARLDK